MKKAPVKFAEDLLYADFCLCPKSVIITTLNEGIVASFTYLYKSITISQSHI